MLAPALPYFTAAQGVASAPRHTFPALIYLGRYRELYRREGAEQARISGYRIELGPRSDGAGFGWGVTGDFGGKRTETAFEVLARARALEAQGRTVLHLEIGEPGVDTAPHIVEAAVKALRDGYTRYCPAAGLPELREAVAAYLSRTRGVPFEAGRVVVAGERGQHPVERESADQQQRADPHGGDADHPAAQ